MRLIDMDSKEDYLLDGKYKVCAPKDYRKDDEMMTNPKEVLEWYEKYPSGHSQTDGDLIIKGAQGMKDGLYNIQNGKLFKYKAKGGTVRTYPIVSAEAVSEDTQTKTELAHIEARLENVEKMLQGLANDVLIGRSRTG